MWKYCRGTGGEPAGESENDGLEITAVLSPASGGGGILCLHLGLEPQRVVQSLDQHLAHIG